MYETEKMNIIKFYSKSVDFDKVSKISKILKNKFYREKKLNL